ncbi:hypothetical protein CCACVL1_08687, partial [Corchorus capsularis]
MSWVKEVATSQSPTVTKHAPTHALM